MSVNMLQVTPIQKEKMVILLSFLPCMDVWTPKHLQKVSMNILPTCGGCLRLNAHNTIQLCIHTCMYTYTLYMTNTLTLNSEIGHSSQRPISIGHITAIQSTVWMVYLMYRKCAVNEIPIFTICTKYDYTLAIRIAWFISLSHIAA